MRRELSDLLDAALDHVTDVRITTRCSDLDQLDLVAEPLTGDAGDLEAFIVLLGC